ncbi:MAG: ATP-binding protein [Candidatus Tectomicrobia bacterium]|nr:ATP-binding protein [Candidatus Tectomicrobia bacterium]
MIPRFKAILLMLLVGLGSFGASTLGIWLYHKMQSVDMPLHYDIVGTMTELDAVDARWNEDILKSRLRLNKNYDPLVRAMVSQNDLGQRLAFSIKKIDGAHPAVQSALSDYQAIIASKLDRVEKFKSQNAILRNSTEYIAFSMHNLSDIIQKTKTKPAVPAETLIALEHHLSELMVGLLEYTSESYTPEFVERQIKALEGLSQYEMLPSEVRRHDILPAAIHRRLQLVLNHVRTMLHKKPIVDNLLTTLISLPTATALHDVRVTYSNLHRQRLEQNRTDQLAFFGYIVLLIIGLAYAILYWHLSHKRHIQILTTENQNLEKEIALAQELSRTHEELDRSQMLLIQSEKMSSLGQMVAGVAHEINTPLAYSRSNVALIHEQMPPLIQLVEASVRQAELLVDPQSHHDALKEQFSTVAEIANSLQQDDIMTDIGELLQASISGLDQISEMVLNMKNFSRLDRKKVDQVNLNDGLESALTIAQNKLKYKVDVVKNYGEIPTITCAPSQINQVFLNLLVNAAQSMEDRGTITLTTLAKGDHVEVRVEDDGQGIPADAMTHIFDPFFTTKDVGEGTGLGLAISYRIIEQHNGAITVESEAGRGACFTISLPINPDAELSLAEEVASSQHG